VSALCTADAAAKTRADIKLAHKEHAKAFNAKTGRFHAYLTSAWALPKLTAANKRK
jgi:hypothetical protein